jgi:phosphoglycolate phosphatase
MPVPRLPFRLIAFDCDGTLVDSQHVILAAMTEAFDATALAPPDPAAVRRVVGLSLEAAVAALLPHLDATVYEAVAESYRRAFFALRSRPDHHEPLFPGARAAIEALNHPETFFGVCTGKGRRGLLAVLERHGLVELFHTLQTADVCAGKPDPEMVLNAMREVGAQPEETVLIGDTTYDMEMARRARVWAIGVDWGYHEPDELRASGAHRIISAFDELPAVVGEIRDETMGIGR